MNKMSEDEAIKQLQYLKDRKINTGDWLINCKDRTAIETILDEFKKYDAGEIISIKVLEKYYLVSKDKEKQMTYANKELFKEYIPKDKIREKIKELEEQEDWYIENKSSDDLYGRIDELKELLEEE